MHVTWDDQEALCLPDVAQQRSCCRSEMVSPTDGGRCSHSGFYDYYNTISSTHQLVSDIIQLEGWVGR